MLRAGPYELEALVAAAEHAHDYREQRNRDLARMIVRELADAMKRGRRGH
jgi:hypothetical protein